MPTEAKLKPDHIDGITGREPIGAALTIGVKDRQRGFPTEKDRFHLVMPHEADGRREHHPAFSFFNGAQADKRRVILGNLVHRTKAECFEYHLKAQVCGKTGHPDKRPCCVGDGKKAVRWMGDTPDNFAEIKCPNDKCEYRLTTPPSCKPWMRFLFRVRWNNKAHPAMLVKFTSGSWNTISNFVGFFDYLDRLANELGVQDATLLGLPFTLTLVERTKASAQRRFPTVSISPDIDPVEWMQRQREAIRALAGPVPTALLDFDQQDTATVYEDGLTITVPAGR